MSATQGNIETQEAIERFTAALQQRIGTDRFRLWFTHGVRLTVEWIEPDAHGTSPPIIVIETSGPFAAERITKNLATDLRASVMASLGEHARFRVSVAEATAVVQDAPMAEGESVSDQGVEATSERQAQKAVSHSGGRYGDSGSSQPQRKPAANNRRRSSNKLSDLLAGSNLMDKTSKKASIKSSQAASDSDQDASRDRGSSRNARSPHSRDAASAQTAPLPPLPESQPTAGRTFDSFITGPCNDFAFSAATMALATPEVATPLFLHGPTGSGKSHLIAALAHEFRSRRRMRRVILLTAEQFTNDFVVSVGSTGLPAFRRRYREVDALLIDDVHFLASKQATLREALYTVETLAAAGKPLVFTANLPPADIRGLTDEVAGRMASGLVCPLTPLDHSTRMKLLQRLVSTRCILGCDDDLLAEVSQVISGDARAVTGIANLIGMLQRMFRREPTIDEIREFGGDLLRRTQAAPTLRSIEKAVCETFGLEGDGLRGKAQTRRVSEPRMLAMFLARQHTGSAFTEIAKHFGRRSHSGAIEAQQKVETWLESGKPIGAGSSAMTAQDAIARIEARLRVG